MLRPLIKWIHWIHWKSNEKADSTYLTLPSQCGVYCECMHSNWIDVKPIQFDEDNDNNHLKEHLIFGCCCCYELWLDLLNWILNLCSNAWSVNEVRWKETKFFFAVNVKWKQFVSNECQARNRDNTYTYQQRTM